MPGDQAKCHLKGHDRDLDRGWAWFVLGAAYFNELVVSGLAFVAGMFQVMFLEEFGESVAKTAWVTSLFSSLMQLGGPVSSMVSMWWGCRSAVMMGSTCLTLGMVVSAMASDLDTLMVTFGLVAGIGLGLVHTASIVVISFYWPMRRTLVNGVVFSAGGLGVLLAPQLVRLLMNTLAWREALFVLAAISVQMCVSGAMMFPQFEKRKCCATDNRLRPNNASKVSSAMMMREISFRVDANDGYDDNDDDDDDENRKRTCFNFNNIDTNSVPTRTTTSTSNNDFAAHVGLESANPRTTYISDDSCPENSTLRGDVVEKYEELQSRDKHEQSDVFPTSFENGKVSNIYISNGNKNTSHCHEEKDKSCTGMGCVSGSDQTKTVVLINQTSSGFDTNNSNIPHSTRDENMPGLSRELQDDCSHVPHGELNTSKNQIQTKTCLDTEKIHHDSSNSYNSINTSSRQNASEKGQNSPTAVDINTFNEFVEVEENGNCPSSIIAHAQSQDSKLYRNKRFLALCLSLFVANAGGGITLIHIASFLKIKGLDDTEVTNALSTNGIGLLAGRVLVGTLASSSPGQDLLLVIMLQIGGGLILILMPVLVSSYYTGVIFVMGMALYSGSVFCLLPTLTIRYVGLEPLALAFGLEMVSGGLGYLVAPPFGGWLVDITASYDYNVYCGGLLMMVSGFILMVIPGMEKKLECDTSKAHGVEKTTCDDATTA